MIDNKNIYLIRHGKASHNIGFDMYGEQAYFNIFYTDTDLIEVGQEQAMQLSKNIGTIFNDIFKKNDYKIVVSPLKRCINTALIAFKEFNIPKTNFICIENLIEYPLGHTPNKKMSKNTLERFYGDKIDFTDVNTKEDTIWNENMLETEDNFKSRIKSVEDKISGFKETNIFIISHTTFLTEFILNNSKDDINELQHCKVYNLFNKKINYMDI